MRQRGHLYYGRDAYAEAWVVNYTHAYFSIGITTSPLTHVRRNRHFSIAATVSGTAEKRVGADGTTQPFRGLLAQFFLVVAKAYLYVYLDGDGRKAKPMQPTGKLWLDDVRRPPDASWTWVKSVAEAEAALVSNDTANGKFVEWSLDHDLGGIPAETGGVYDSTAPSGLHFVTNWILRGFPLPARVTVHSVNHGPAQSMMTVLGHAIHRHRYPTDLRYKPEWRTH